MWLRKPGHTDSYKLNKADNLLMKLVESLKSIESSTDTPIEAQLEDAGRFAQQLRAARFEFRFDEAPKPINPKL